jgi:uncharacterized membrane protein YhiD involved in acid resistance
VSAEIVHHARHDSRTSHRRSVLVGYREPSQGPSILLQAAAAAAPTTLQAFAEAIRLSVFAKLLLATILGGAIGVEREFAGKPAGLRTNILICVGAALFTQLSIDIAQVGFSPDRHPYGDTTRIAAQIVSGIGFLGAGAILHGQGSVVGLTTAATVWVVAAIGAAVGAGAYVDACGATVLIMLVLIGLKPLEDRLQAKRRRLHVTLRVKVGCSFGQFDRIIRENGVHVAAQRTFEHDTDRSFELDLIGATKQFDLLIDRLRTDQNVVSVTTE